MKVVATGPEASGTRLLTRLLDAHPDLEVIHRSMPHGGSGQRHWPTDRDFDDFGPQFVVVIVRDMVTTAISQVRARHVPTIERAMENIREALALLIAWCALQRVPWIFTTYEQLVTRPRSTLQFLCDCLGVEPIEPCEDINDGNGAYA